MTYRALMVNVELGLSNTGLLEITRDLAEHFDAGVIGVTACQPLRNAYSGFGDGYIAGEIVQADRDEIERQSNDAKAAFEQVLQSRLPLLTWRGSVNFGSLADSVARQARCADLILVGAGLERSPDPARRMDIAGLIMRAGRPVLIVPHGASKLKLRHVLVGWKNTREARRALADSLPLLKMAEQVTLLGVAEAQGVAPLQVELDDVVVWLHRHAVKASGLASPKADDGAKTLDELAERHGADLIVAGAYGHSRLSEWALGGVTRDLLLHGRHAMLMSH